MIQRSTTLLTIHRTIAALSLEKRESGFEIAQSMGIALLGLETLGVDIIDRIRTELGL